MCNGTKLISSVGSVLGRRIDVSLSWCPRKDTISPAGTFSGSSWLCDCPPKIALAVRTEGTF